MKKYIKVVLMAVIVVLLVAACAPAAPASRFDAIKKAGKIVVGTSADYEPWEYKDADGNFVGIDMDIMREIGKRMGVEVEFQDLGFDALVTAVQEGKVDAAIAAMASTAERKQAVDFSVMYYAGDNDMLVAKDSTISFTDPLKAANYKIGTQSGTIMYTWVQKNLIEPGLMKPENLFLYERNEQVALDLQAGRIDIAVMDEEPGKQFMRDPAFGFKEVWSGIMETEGQAIAIKKGETALKAELDKDITNMLKEGLIDTMLKKYGVEQ